MYELFENLLKENQTTAYRVSKQTGISQSTFTDWKNGRSVPKTDKLKKIADYFGVSVEYFSGGEKTTEMLKGVIVGFDKEQAPIEITREEYEIMKSVLNTIRQNNGNNK